MALKGHIPWNKGKTFMVGEDNPMYGVRRFGESSPHYGKPHSIETKEMIGAKVREHYKTHPNPMLGKKRPDLVARNGLLKGKTCEEIYGERAPALRKSYGSPLESHPLWRGGTSFEPYDSAFTKELKAHIKDRDNYTCQICKEKKDPLHVHHKDYDKLNSVESNLVSLCESCHTKTNFDRQSWTTYWEAN